LNAVPGDCGLVCQPARGCRLGPRQCPARSGRLSYPHSHRGSPHVDQARQTHGRTRSPAVGR